MRILIGVLSVISMGVVSQANAMDPPTQPAASTTTSPTAEPTPPASAPATADQSAAAKTAPSPSTADGNATGARSPDGKVKLVAGDSEADQQLKRFKAAGYKPEMRNGEVLFCRREAVLGSRFEKKVCNTADGLDRQMIEARNAVDKAQRDSTIAPRSN